MNNTRPVVTKEQLDQYWTWDSLEKPEYADIVNVLAKKRQSNLSSLLSISARAANNAQSNAYGTPSNDTNWQNVFGTNASPQQRLKTQSLSYVFRELYFSGE